MSTYGINRYIVQGDYRGEPGWTTNEEGNENPPPKRSRITYHSNLFLFSEIYNENWPALPLFAHWRQTGQALNFERHHGAVPVVHSDGHVTVHDLLKTGMNFLTDDQADKYKHWANMWWIESTRRSYQRQNGNPDW